MIQMTYTLVSNLEEAKKIAKILIQEKLAACVNILPSIVSIYEWKGQIEESNEVGLLIKCSLSNQENLVKRLQALHPYELPAICSLQTETSAEFQAWINQ
jgi:periplasmic divalent cation tolerance protein